MEARFDNGHALLVGVGADLPNTIDDAIGLADVLKDSSRCAYPPEQVALLTGPAADRAGILAGWIAWRRPSNTMPRLRFTPPGPASHS